MDAKEHWDSVYRARAPAELGWYQPHPVRSLDLIGRTGVGRSSPILDVGGGASTLVDHLLDAGYTDLAVLDVSAEALRLARERLGPRASRVLWIEADITSAAPVDRAYAVWHDRAVFHFLTEPAARERYVQTVRRSVPAGGHVIVATFAADGPSHCSGLEVVRYSADSLERAFGDGFHWIATARDVHVTPAGTEQSFLYCYGRTR